MKRRVFVMLAGVILFSVSVKAAEKPAGLEGFILEKDLSIVEDADGMLGIVSSDSGFNVTRRNRSRVAERSDRKTGAISYLDITLDKRGGKVELIRQQLASGDGEWVGAATRFDSTGKNVTAHTFCVRPLVDGKKPTEVPTDCMTITPAACRSLLADDPAESAKKLGELAKCGDIFAQIEKSVVTDEYLSMEQSNLRDVPGLTESARTAASSVVRKSRGFFGLLGRKQVVQRREAVNAFGHFAVMTTFCEANRTKMGLAIPAVGPGFDLSNSPAPAPAEGGGLADEFETGQPMKGNGIR